MSSANPGAAAIKALEEAKNIRVARTVLADRAPRVPLSEVLAEYADDLAAFRVGGYRVVYVPRVAIRRTARQAPGSCGQGRAGAHWLPGATQHLIRPFLSHELLVLCDRPTSASSP
ncbi:MAG: hypothetical protein ACRDTD_10870 [Pseudonocardiaceae bacterium]